MDYAYRLSEDQEAALARSLGKLVAWLYAPWLDVRIRWFLAPSVSFPVGGSYLTIAAAEFHQPWEDIVKVTAVIEPHPSGIPEGRLDDGRRVMGSPVSTMSVPGGDSPVESISVFEVVETGEDNTTVTTDEGLLFVLESGKRLLITAFRSIMGGLECTIDEAEISKYVRESTVRRVIK